MARKTRRLRGGRGYTTGAGAELKQMSMAPVMGGGKKKRYSNKSVKRILNKKNKEHQSKRINNESARIYKQQENFYEFLTSSKLNPHAKSFVPSK